MDCSEVTTLRVREQMKRTCDGDRKGLEHRGTSWTCRSFGRSIPADADGRAHVLEDILDELTKLVSAPSSSVQLVDEEMLRLLPVKRVALLRE